MTEAVAVFPPGFRLTDSATGAPLSGAVISFFDAGTTSPKTVYADAGLSTALGTTVTTDSLGYPTSDGSTKTIVWLGTAAYKVTIETAADVLIASHDNVKGAVEVTDVGDLSVNFETPVVTKSLNYTVLAADQSKEFVGNCTGGDVTFTLPSAATVGDGWFIFIQHGGTANQVKIATVSSQTLSDGAQSYGASMALVRTGESLKLTSDGGNWRISLHTPPHIKVGSLVLTIADRLSSPPGSPADGELNIVTSSPSGAWSSFAEHDVAMYTGAAWIKFTPPTDCGWIAYVQDEDRCYQFRGSAWALGVEPTASSTVAGLTKVSTQAIMETGTATDAAVLVGHQHFHPGHPKASLILNGEGTIAIIEDYGVASVADNGTGLYTATFDGAFSNASNYGPAGAFARSGSAGAADANIISAPSGATKTTTTFQIECSDVTGGSVEDAPEIGVIWTGDL